MNNYNYPPGSDVPWSPWNQEEPELEECWACGGTGVDDEGYDCHNCGGTGEIEAEQEGKSEEPDRD